MQSARKIYQPGGAVSLAAWLAELPRPLVFTNGCFDILHRGHVDCLEQAAALGDALLVGVNSDASVRLLDKGRLRPINPLADRMAVLAALASVAGVVAYDDATPLALIAQARPAHLVKGGDWPLAQIVGAAEVVAWGGQVHALAFRFQRSTSQLVDKIRGG